MKKQNPQTYLLSLPVLSLALSLFLFTACNNAPGRTHDDPPCPHDGKDPLPYMWVPKEKSIERTKLFKHKHDLLQAQQPTKPETDSIDFDVSSFRGMLEHIKDLSDKKRVDAWIAAYGDEGTDSVPSGLGNTLTIIFTPVNSGDQIVEYYTLPPKSKGFDIKKNGLTQKIAEGWMNNYALLKMPYILPTIDDKDHDNYTDGKPTPDKKTFSDTRNMRYDFDDIMALDTEINHQASTNNITISGVRAYFSAYPATGNADRKYKNRLLIQYEFLRKDSAGNDIVFYLEDGDDFCTRPWPPHHLDNGQMCPPSCVPPPPPPPSARLKKQ